MGRPDAVTSCPEYHPQEEDTQQPCEAMLCRSQANSTGPLSKSIVISLVISGNDSVRNLNKLKQRAGFAKLNSNGNYHYHNYY